MVYDKERNVWEKVLFPQPTIVKEYNLGIGGNDGIDQWIAMCRPKTIQSHRHQRYV